MNVETFTAIVAALVVVRLIEPGVKALRDKLWGNPRVADRRTLTGAAGGTGPGIVSSARARR